MVLVSVVLMAGAVLAWFASQSRLSSVGKIHPLTYISILAPGNSMIQSIDLSYDKSEVHNGVVELKRPFVIRSETESYDLCIAHTTNISGLKISLYQAEDNGSDGDADLSGITEKGIPYFWKKKEPNLFDENGYQNKETSAETGRIQAAQNHDAHDETFRLTENEVYSKVQKYAEPLYWVKRGLKGQKQGQDDNYYYTNYILEITWDETDKETDILYVIAQTDDAGSTDNENG